MGKVALMSRCSLLLSMIWGVACAVIQAAEPPVPSVDFAREIQPLLASACAKCHGGDTAESGLHILDRTSALSSLDSGARAIVPGDVEQSELLRRVRAMDAEIRMPPTGPGLTQHQIAKLRQWIEAGADWPEHWSYRSLVQPSPPMTPETNDATWPHTAIDPFILAKQREAGVEPATPADKRTLLRRVTFDLLGLPPTPEEVEAFLADESPSAYEQVVERLLASPHLGERWARHWMDLVHFAETHGHDQDRPREHAWPYRDYLIQAFNDDKPYARFILEQVAGDALFPLDTQAQVATGMLAAGPWDESSLRDIREDTVDREIARYLDRDDIVTTVMSTFVSSTVHCARCHDHKFDPISQVEYYGLQAVFAGTDKANRSFDPDPAITVRRQALLRQLTELQQPDLERVAFEPELLTEIASWERQLRESAPLWHTADVVECRSAAGTTLTRQEDGSILASALRPERDTYTVVIRSHLKQITGLRLELLTDPSLPHQGPGRQDNGNLHLNEIVVHASEHRASTPSKRLTLRNPQADFNQSGWAIDMALDGNPATAWGIYPAVGQPHHANFELAEPLTSADEKTLIWELQQTHGGGHLIGRFRLLLTNASLPLPPGLSSLPGEIASILSVATETRSQEQHAAIVAYYWKHKLERELEALPKQQLVYCGTSHFQADGSFRPSAAPRPVHVLTRGEITQPGTEVTPAALSCVSQLGSQLSPASNDDGSRRAALAKWLASTENVLTWRSIANRLWHYHFGIGLVDTPNDFGRMGSPPSHPELLDWLATEILRQDGSLKALHRQIVTSAAYRQASQYDSRWAAIDADNRLLWRMHRRRLDAESIRDAVLRMSGMLDERMGGPSVKQFIQSPGIHVTPKVDYMNFDPADPANRRRSVYRFVFRTIPDPFMEALDCPDSSQLTPNRSESITALQALALLNDKFMVRHAELLAERIADNDDEHHAPVAMVFQLLYARPPREDEVATVQRFVDQHGWASACRLLLNTNEFIFVD